MHTKKYLAEAIGTMVLVLMGCGAAAIAGATNAGAIGRLGVSLSFGLAVLIMVYAIGPIS
jgi:aquaporin Z